MSAEPAPIGLQVATPHSALPLPDAVDRRAVVWPYVTAMIAYHLVALLAFVPWFFSWTGVIVCVVGIYLFGLIGINLCYHRLLTHRGFKCPKLLEYTMAVLGVLCVQDTPARWVAIHRRHHEHSDEQPDPHSPQVNFFWGHVGWVAVANRDLDRFRVFERYAKDLLRDPFYVWFERNYNYYKVFLLTWPVYFLAGFGAELALGGTRASAAQFGLSLVVWGVALRTIIVWHQTWCVNSITHRWGYRNYATDEGSRNNLFVGFFSNGEGWHNNHHADPRSARHGHRWFEIDITYLTLRALAALRLASDVVGPSPHLKSVRNTRLETHRYPENQPGAG